MRDNPYQLSLRVWLGLVMVIVPLTPAVADSRQDARQEYSAGMLKSDERKYDEAIEHFTKAVELDPEYADAYAARAKAYEAIDDLDHSFKDREQAAQLRVAEDVSRHMGWALAQRPEFWLTIISIAGCGVIAAWIGIRKFNTLRGARAPDFDEQDNWGSGRKT